MPYIVILIILSFTLLHIIIKRNERHEKAGCLLTLMAAIVWIATFIMIFLVFSMSYTFSHR